MSRGHSDLPSEFNVLMIICKSCNGHKACRCNSVLNFYHKGGSRNFERGGAISKFSVVLSVATFYIKKIEVWPKLWGVCTWWYVSNTFSNYPETIKKNMWFSSTSTLQNKEI